MIYIISKRQGEKDWSFRNKFSEDNAVVSGTASERRAVEANRLREKAERMVSNWQANEPETQFKVVDSGLEGGYAIP